jgi:hypothetical protein
MVCPASRMKQVRRILASTLVTTLVAGCGSTLEPDGPAAITGPIVARDVTISTGSAPTIHVKESPTESCGIIFLLRSSTRVLHRTANGRTTKASVSDLSVGQRVSVWTDLVLDSCPGQASADVVEIID